MPKYQVSAEFQDLEAKLRRKAGEVIEASELRARALLAAGVISPEPLADAADKGDADPRYKALSGGWYELANGEKVHGKEALAAALAAFEAAGSGQGGEV